MSGAQSSLRSVFFVSACSFGHLIVQFAFQLVLANYFGASQEMDAYVAAIALPTVATSVLVGSLSYAFVPVFIERRDREGADAAWETASTFGFLVIVSAGALSVVGFLLAGSIVETVYPELDAEQTQGTADLLQVLVWLTLTNSLTNFLHGLFHSERRFAVPAVASIVGTAATLVFVLFLQPQFGIAAVAWGVLLGAVLSVAIQLPIWLRNIRFVFTFDEATLRCFRMLGPLMLGAAYFRLDPLIDRWLASGMPTGSLSHLGYAGRLVTAILTISTSGLSIVAFPALVAHAVSGQRETFRAEIAHAIRFLCFVCIPIVVGAFFFSEPVIGDLFERGEFTSADTRMVAILVVLYLGMVVGASLGEVTSKVFYSMGNTRTPVLINAIGFTLGVILKVLLAPVYGVAGIVAATSIYYLLNSGWMVLLIEREIGGRAYAGVIGAVARALSGSALATVAAYAVLFMFPLPFASLLAASAGLLTYLGVMLLIGDEFAMRLFAFLVRRPLPLSMRRSPMEEEPDARGGG